MTAMERLNTQHQFAAQASRVRETTQQAPRAARVRTSVDVRGAGETRLQGKKAINFGALMLEEPTFSSGVIVKTPLKFGELPQATAMVTKWVQNSSGCYTGAEVAFFVDSPRADIHLLFTLTFEGSTLRSTAPVSSQTDSTS